MHIEVRPRYKATNDNGTKQTSCAEYRNRQQMTRIAMTALDTSTELRFEPPGPGSWEQDPVHFPRPMTRYFQETHPPSFKRGTHDFARFDGMLIDGIQIGYVNGFGYIQVLPAPEAEIPERFQ